MPSVLDRLRGVFYEKVEDGTEENLEELPDALPSPGRPAATRPVTASSGIRPATPRPAQRVAPLLAVPEPVKALVDQQFNDAASPALTAWADINQDVGATVSDVTARNRLVLSMMGRLGHDPAAIYTDIGECRDRLATIRGQVEGAKEAEIKEKVIGAETEAANCLSEVETLERRIMELRTRAQEKTTAAQTARFEIDQTHAATLAYLDQLEGDLDRVLGDVQVASPTTPVPPSAVGQKV